MVRQWLRRATGWDRRDIPKADVSLQRSLQMNVRGNNPFVTPRLPINAIAHAIEIGLEVKQNPGWIVVEDLEHVVDDGLLRLRVARLGQFVPARKKGRIAPAGGIGDRRRRRQGGQLSNRAPG